jgi:uncharacterized protein (TIGR03118 family)
MNLLSQPRRRFLGRKEAASDGQRPYRPVLECLEDRCLLSGGFAQVNLASDVPGLARVTDPNLVNPWGAAFSPTGPFWLADNGSGVSDLLDGRGQPLPLVVKIPSGTPTGTVFNGGSGFVISANGVAAPSRFLFATQDGTISGWTTLVDPTHALLTVDNSSSGADYTGLALATDSVGHSFLYAADLSRGTIDMFDQEFRSVVRPGSFQDPNLPNGFVPFNIQNINNLLFVTYAQQDEDRHEDVAGAGHGFIDVYDTEGSLVKRFASQGVLNSPWGLALAPANFGPFGGALLVGNNGDGHITAYDPGSGAFLGQLADDNGIPLAIPDLWALTFGNGHVGGESDTLFFTAGVDYDAHGLFGAIQDSHRRGADTAGSGAFDPNAPGEVGDYPLPPGGGPVFLTDRADRPIPVSDLLPLRESSLLLVPTLSTFSPSSTRPQAPVPAVAMGDVSLNGSVLTADPAANAIMVLPPEGNSHPARGAPPDGSLNAFLDLNASPNHSQNQTDGGQRPGANLHAVGVHRLPLADRDAGAEDLLFKASAQPREAQSSEEQGPAGSFPSDQAIPVESRKASADEGAGGKESVKPSSGGWTNLMNLFLVVSLPLIWGCWLRHEMKSRQSSEGPARGDLAKRRPVPGA